MIRGVSLILSAHPQVNGEPSQEEKGYLDGLRAEAEHALQTQAIFADGEEHAREARLESMRETYQKMSQAIPCKPKEEEPGYPTSLELLNEIAVKEQELENFRLTFCAEVEGRW